MATLNFCSSVSGSSSPVLNIALSTVAAVKSVLVRVAPVKSAPLRLAPAKLALVRSALRKMAGRKSTNFHFFSLRGGLHLVDLGADLAKVGFECVKVGGFIGG